MAAGETRRDSLVRAALELLESEGPEAVSTRKVAARVGASTMVVYSEFGSLAGLVSSVVDAGFGVVAGVMREVAVTDDPIADLARVGDAYLAFARERPHLYRVIYAVSPLAGHRREGVELLQGADAFALLQEFVLRAFRAGSLTATTPYAAALQMWTSLHGLALLELAGYQGAMRPLPEPVAVALVRTLAYGLGASPAAVEAALGPAPSYDD